MSMSSNLEKFHTKLRINKLSKEETITSLDADSRSDKRNESNRRKLCIQLSSISLNPNSFMFARYFSEQVDGSAAFWY